jgi:excisionase family DNA binding protein
MIDRNDPTIPPKLLDPEVKTIGARELAELTGLHWSTVYRHLERNQLAARRIGRRYIVTREAALTWFLSEPASLEGASTSRAA